MRRYYLTYRGREYGAFDTLTDMLGFLQNQLIKDENLGRDLVKNAWFRAEEVASATEAEDECNE